MSFIQVKKLGHKFNIKDKDGNVTGEKWAVKDMDFIAHKGQIIAVLGRNGSGKSTFARHLNGLYAPDQGTVWIQGDSDVLDTSREDDLLAIRRAVGMIFQNPDNQMVGNTVAEDVGFGLENLGFQAEKIWERINEVLRLTRNGGISGTKCITSKRWAEAKAGNRICNGNVTGMYRYG